ncbi:G-type lectin S-receptor-like serine/threonine-protein kinase RKS1 [Linum perenne]
MNPFSILLLLLLSSSSSSSLNSDTLTPHKPLLDGDVLLSSAQTFALGFFSRPQNSLPRYLGIWYHTVSEQTVVWVANRESPLNDTSGRLALDSNGYLNLHAANNTSPIWSAKFPNLNNSVAQILDSGNLVVVQDRTGTVLWQSFDYPTDTLLPYMKLGFDRRTGLNRSVTSWKSETDPGIGSVNYRIDPTGYPQLFLYKNHSVPTWRGGPWTGLRWSGVLEMSKNYIFNVSYVNDKNEVSILYGITNASILSRMYVEESGVVKRATWNGHGWIEFWSAPKEQCDNYGTCGPNSNCDPSKPDTFYCKCQPGFEPKSGRDWYLRDGSGGCVRKAGGKSTCRSGEGFVKVARVKVPDTSVARVEMGMGLKECEEECLKNCTCEAYTSADERGIGCLRWYGELVDTRSYSGGGQDIYVRVDADVLGRLDLFTIEMHFNGLLTHNDYLYGSIACFDRVDPDYLSLIELNAMADLVNVEGEFYQFLWPHPGKGIADGLLGIECEDHVLAFIKARQNVDEFGVSMGAPFSVMKIYVKKLSEFEARMRIGQIKMELHRGTIETRVQFSLEEINTNEDVEGVSASSTGTGLGDRSSRIPELPWIDQGQDNNPITVTASDIVPNKEGHDTHSQLACEDGITMEADEDSLILNNTTVVEVNDSPVPHLCTAVEVNGSDVPHLSSTVEVNGSDVPHLSSTVEVNGSQVPTLGTEVDLNEAFEGQPPLPTDAEVNDIGVPPHPTDLEVNETGVPPQPTESEANLEGVPQVTTWLGVDEVLAEMEREEALNEPLQDLEEYWSSPTIDSSSDTPGEFWDGRYNPYSSEEDTDPAYAAFYSEPSSPDYAPSESSNPSTESDSDSDSEVRGQDVHSQAGSNGEAASDARNQDDECDRVRDEEEMVGERGWGSEEDEEIRPDRYPIFCSARDLEAAEIVIGREYESFEQFKQFCKVNAVKNRRGVKFPVNDKIRCRCVCVKECGFWLSARKRGSSDSVVLISGQPEHDCLVEEDIRAANPAFLANHYVARFRIDPSWSLRNFIHTVITDFGLKINMMKAYRAKRVALSLIHGEENDQFKKLWDYGAELKRTNPGTTVDIRYDGLTFQSIYICLDALKKGFIAGCRRFIGLDGCHLKNIPGWQLLAAVGVDGNDGRKLQAGIWEFNKPSE